MCYENAPATKLLATHCACCNRKLVDAVSVEVGVGPICREKHGYNDGVDDDTRARANKLVHFIAAARVGNKVDDAVKELKTIGFSVLAGKIVERLDKAEKAAEKITISPMGDDMFSLDTPFRAGRKDEFTAALRRIPGRRWNSSRRLNTFPTTSKVAVFRFLQEFFPGKFGRGPKGVFQIPKASK